MASPDLYPPAPDDVPANFTKPTGEYRLRVLGVLASLFAFLLFYFLLIVAIGVAAAWLALHPPISNGRGGFIVVMAYVGGLAALGMLFIFLVKGLFKGQHTDRDALLKIERSQHPELFRFIDRICDETSAPRPAGVYLSPEVNAAVFYDTTLLNLIVPPRKYLLIGAGLVNAVNLREFKAVLAHEFGHFSQKSLAVGTYVYVANRVMGDIVYSRDSWDHWLRQWCNLDIRISFPAWGLLGVVWVIRKTLTGAFKGINLLNLSLSRQMEFNADNVAVSVAGSDAIVTTLCRVEFADRCFALNASELHAAADHGFFSRDVFHHHKHAGKHVRTLAKDPKLGIPPPPPERVFDPEHASHGPAMWASHPANHEREANAKETYFPAEKDPRSPWLLFNDVDGLKAKLSRNFYKHGLGRPVKSFDEPDAVQAFIDAERSETSYDPKYHGYFDDRILGIGNPADVPSFDPDANLAAFFANFPPANLAEVMAAHTKRQGEANLMAGLRSGALSLKTGRTFEYRDRQATLAQVPRLLKEVRAELDADREKFAIWDQAMLAARYQAAHVLDPARAADLRRRYEFLLAVQHWIVLLNEQQSVVDHTLSSLGVERQLSEDDFLRLASLLQDAADRVDECHSRAQGTICPEMSNVPEGSPLSDLIRDPKWRRLRLAGESTLDGETIGKLVTGLNNTLDRLRRVFFKSLGTILTRQEQIAADYRLHTAGQ